MQRFALLAATVFVGSVGLSSAHAQEPDSFDGPQGADDYYEPEETYDDEPVPYDESYDETAPYDDSQGEPFEEPPDGYDDSAAYGDEAGYEEAGAPQEDASVDTFYESLSPYGRCASGHRFRESPPCVIPSEARDLVSLPVARHSGRTVDPSSLCSSG